MPEEKAPEPFTPDDEEGLQKAMDELTEADIAEVINRMHAAMQLADAGLITPEEQAKIAAGEPCAYEIELGPEGRAEFDKALADARRMRADAAALGSSPTFVHKNPEGEK